MGSLDNEITLERHLSIVLESPVNPEDGANETVSKIVVNMTKEALQLRTMTKSLKSFLWTKIRSLMGVWAFLIFASIAMTVGILTICFTISDRTNKECLSMFSTKIKYKFETWSNPASVAVGDFNHDHRLDIVVANSGIDNIGIFFGHGDGTFAKQMTLSTDIFSQPESIAVGDFDNDDHLDIAVANRHTHNVGIFFGYGNGTFTNQMTISTGPSRPAFITIGDIDKDNRLDIMIANPDTESVGVFLGYGNRTFSRQMTFSTGYDSNPSSIAIGDLNNDNQLDMAVMNEGTGTLGIFLGYGNGSFATQTIYSVGIGSGSKSIAMGDFNSDSRLDIVIANPNSINVGLFLGYGNGSFAVQTTYSIDPFYRPYFVTVGDFNNNSKLDIGLVDMFADGLIVLLGDGNGTLEFLAIYDTGPFSLPQSGVIGDFNQDMHLDIAIGVFSDGSVKVLLGYGNGSFQNPITSSTGSAPEPKSVAVGDFNNDTRLDIVIANWRTNCLGVLLGYGTGYFSNQTTYSTGDGSLPQSVAVGDFNNDNKLDLITASIGASNVGIFLGYGNGSFAPQRTFSTGTSASPLSVAVGDLNDDSQLDAVVPNIYNDNVAILLGDGHGNLVLFSTYFTGDQSQPYSTAIGDLNNDNRLDIIVANFWGNSVGVFLGIGNGSFASQIISYVGDGLSPQFLAIGDFNNDARLDIIISIFYSDAVGVLFGYGNGSFTSSTIYSTGIDSHPQTVVVGHFNNDTQLDIAVANDGSHGIGVFLGYDNGSFTNLTTYWTDYGSSPSSLAIGDFNNDAQLDLAVTCEGDNSISIFLRSC